MPRINVDEFGIDVDDDGYLSGIVYEGALGFVVQIAACSPETVESTNGPPRALKLPRLLADTDQENQFVCSLTELEVKTAAQLAGAPGLTSLDYGGRSLLRTLSRRNNLESAVIVQFSKEMKPRLCLVSADVLKEGLIFTPHLKDLSEWLTPELWREGINLSRGGTGRLDSPIIFRRTEGEAPAPAAALLLVKQQVGRESVSASDQSWYLGLPSPVYFWRGGTLEHAIRKGHRGLWRWYQHCELIEQLAKGLLSLYQRRLVHGDLRPANIMHGERHAKPDDYALIDYASYGLADVLGNPATPSKAGNTLVGVAVAEARQSPFYPVERRVGRERENCDTVVIRRTGEYWVAHVGYRDDMYTGSTEELSDATKQQMASVLDSNLRTVTPDDTKDWKRRDKIRIRDFVFEIAAWRTGPTGFSIAADRGWLVRSNRILVPLDVTAFESKDRVLSVSRTFPIWQWSMATDFFSLGVTLLYSLFYTSIAEEQSDRESGGLESEFEAMIAVMSSAQYASVILPQVAAVARLLGAIWRDEEFRDVDKFTPDRVAKLKLVEKTEDTKLEGAPNRREFGRSADIKDNRVLVGRAWSIAMSVVQTTPGARRVLKAVNRNLAIFVCLIDLAMELMHRREDVPGVPQMLSPWMCDDRTSAPDPAKVNDLMESIGQLKAGVTQRFENATIFECPETDILKYSSSSEPLLRIQMQGKEGEIETCRVEIETCREEIQELRERVAAGEKALNDAAVTCDELTERFRQALNLMAKTGFKSAAIKEFLETHANL